MTLDVIVIVCRTRKGISFWDAKNAALQMCVKEQRSVEFEFNNQWYIVHYTDLDDAIQQKGGEALPNP